MKRTENILRILFAAYLVFLVWAILFKFGFSLEAIRGERVLNLMPYYNDGRAALNVILTEIRGNVIIFIPFGLYLYLMGRRNLLKDALLIAGFSFSQEALQYLFACGVTDITDLINNTAGGILGYALGALLLALFHRKDQAIRFLTGLSTVGTFTMYLGILLTNNFRIFVVF